MRPVRSHSLAPVRSQRWSTRFALFALASLLASAGCSMERRHSNRGDARSDSATAAEGVAIGIGVPEVRFVRNLIGFQGPESAKYDAEQDVFFVSNMTGYG